MNFHKDLRSKSIIIGQNKINETFKPIGGKINQESTITKITFP